jgi:deoxyribodipyrimidine photo-lyase
MPQSMPPLVSPLVPKLTRDELPVTHWPPTLAAAQARIAAVRPADYARSRNFIGGAVTGLSPYITHGLVSLSDVLTGVLQQQPLDVSHKFVFELGWRAYFRHVWQHRGEGILQSLHEGLLPDAAYATALPEDIRQACTGVPAIDRAIQTLYASGMLHNHARMWLASYVVHLRKVHWRVGADWLYAHLLDGDLASNHLSWQWVAATGSHKPYLFNAENVARYAPPEWHSEGTVIDSSYEALDEIARQVRAAKTPRTVRTALDFEATPEPPLFGEPPAALGEAFFSAPDGADVAGRDVWLVHAWHLAALPADLPDDVVVVATMVADHHQAWPWDERRWSFVAQRMAELTPLRWWGDAAAITNALSKARRVRSVDEPHLAPWLPRWAQCVAAPQLFAQPARRCDSFSRWWKQATQGLESAHELLHSARSSVPSW